MNRLSQLKMNTHLFATDLGDLGAGEFFCPNCGAPIMTSDKQCANCGFDLVAYREGRPQPATSTSASATPTSEAQSATSVASPTSSAATSASAVAASENSPLSQAATSTAASATSTPDSALPNVDERVIESAASAAAILSAIQADENPEEVIAKLKAATQQLMPEDLGSPASAQPESSASLSSRREAHIADKTKDISDIVDQVRAATDSNQAHLLPEDLKLESTAASSAQSATRMSRHEKATTNDAAASYTAQRAITPEERAAASLKQDATAKATASEQPDEPAAKPTATQKDEPSHSSHKSKRKWWIIAIIVVVILLGAFVFGQQYFSRGAQLDRAFAVLATNNPSQVSQIMASSSTDLRLTPGNSRPFVRFTKANPQYLKKSKAQLKQASSTKDGTLGFIKEGHHFIFTAYQLTITPTYRTISTDLPAPSIYLDGQNVTAKKPAATQKIGPFIPGTYTLKVEAQSGDKTLSRTVHPTFLVADAQTIDMTLKPVTPVVHSNVANATVYVNNENKGTLQNGQLKLPALNWEANLKLHLETQIAGKTVKTKAVTLTKATNQSIDANFTNLPTKAQTQDLLNRLYQTAGNATNANNTNNTAALAAFFKNGTNAAAYKKLATFISQARDSNSNIDHTDFKVQVEQVLTSNDQTTVNFTVTYTTSYVQTAGLQTRIQTYRYTGAHLTSASKNLQVIDFGSHEEKTADNNAN
ncbi:TcaA 3rd/4th domain-containing protein [Loigolactobacillus binensis]|uniref:Zinc-ribbon domain-containing protein n=1 Tax=Loigolactobacillus binensis TaxID=2559922 RepID=A0ABW3EAX6_9LACO|nr:zinc-ribbon domain-containing protein [Loigolactobacillus binensis]